MNTLIKITLLIAAISILSCNSTAGKKQNSTKTLVGEFDWILGEWERLNEEVGKETYENWRKINKNEYSGIGFTMLGEDTIKQEKMRITNNNGKWVLAVKVPQEKESVLFANTELKKDEFTFSNDSLDFPKKIKYWKKYKNMKALVSGDSLQIDFEFRRLE